MLGKRSRATTIAKLAGALRSAGIVDSATSPRSPLDCRVLSPRGSKNYDQLGGVGLGLVVALDNNSSVGNGEILAKYAICGQFSSRSNPIPVNYPSKTNKNKHDDDHDRKGGEDQDVSMMEEEFTYVTCHGPNKSVTTKVYYDGCEHAHAMARRINQNIGVFNISSPSTLFDDRSCSDTVDFLSSCHLCRKTLHGKDIYMYRGEKAFCSAECRQRQIGIDERKEHCRSEASRSGNVSSSPYSFSSRGQIFSAGIVAV